ncbi:MAG: protein-glutamate O-methyltransferase CheR [Candidatus Omnitrophica bacterium]|nr:protein-glutamate O-methyltransferase CheR [Candidatus Omnitrophota bacterium]
MEEIKSSTEANQEQLNKVIHFINKKKGIDLYSYRQSFTFRHLRSRMSDLKISNYLDYIMYLKNNPREIDSFLEDLSINVTHFFRDPEVFTAFQKGPLAELISRKAKSNLNLIRLWSAACASGQEPYSLAIMMSEALAGRDDFVVKIWATDIDNEALEKARLGEYEEKDLKEAGKKILEKYFQPVYNGKYSVKDSIKKMVRFEKHDLISGPGLKFIDIIFCRNVMIYFTREQQELLFGKFHNSLNSNGYLVIAKVESIWNKEMFVNIDPYNKIYRKAG